MGDHVPDTLYGYVVYVEGSVLRVFSDLHTVDLVWEEILQARSGFKWLKFWCPPTSGKFSCCIIVDPAKVVAVRYNDESMQPNLAEQRLVEAHRRSSSQQVHGRVGQVAVPPKSAKR